MRKKLACIVGARPQFIKYGILRRSISRVFEVSLFHTGQHTDPRLFSHIFADLQIPFPDKLFSVAGATREERLLAMQSDLYGALKAGSYNAVVLFGDTDSTLAGVLAATECGLPAIHIEAGERSHNLTMPEEQNRVTTDQGSRLLCCSSHNAEQNLRQESNAGSIVYTGDLMKDLIMQSMAGTGVIAARPYYYASIHRNYTRSHQDTLAHLFDELNRLQHPVIFSLHPSTAHSLANSSIELHEFNNIRFIDPVSYHQSISYQAHAEAVITDSGGMQKEAYWLKKPCITLRPETEWTETLSNHCNQLYYNDGSLGELLLNLPEHFNEQLYGFGDAAERITSAINNMNLC